MAADRAAEDGLYVRRACELAARGVGSTSPNPPVGAVVVRDGRTVGEGFHERRGRPHAEAVALGAAGERSRGATLYVSLEPCAHFGVTPPCSDAIVAAGVVRVVVGVLDPNPRTNGRGVRRLREAGVAVDVRDDAAARCLIEAFTVAISTDRPSVTLKMASSVDGYVAPRPGPHSLSGPVSRAFVRELRCTHDAVLVGGGTVATDDPLLTVRPPHARRAPYVRACVCDGRAVDAERRIFSLEEGYARTIVLAAGPRQQFRQLERVADVVFVGEAGAPSVDLCAALREMKERGMTSILCEGGPRLAARLLSAGVVDRIEWLIAPRLLAGPQAVPALHPGRGAPATEWCTDLVQRLGDDTRVSLRPVPPA